MNIELLTNGSPYCPMVRIFGTSPTEFISFHNAIVSLGDETASRLELHQLPGFVGLDGLKLILIVEQQRSGISLVQSPNYLNWSRSRTGWQYIGDLTLPFCDIGARNKFQWLEGPFSEGSFEDDTVNVLLSWSENGSW